MPTTKPAKKIEVTACPFCNSFDVTLGHTTNYWVSCNECGADGPSAPTAKAANQAWSDARQRFRTVTLYKDSMGFYESKES